MGVEYKDYYRILDVDRDADSRAIEAAYQRGMRHYRRGSVQEDAAAQRRVKDLKEAYAVLSDPALRQEYDYFAGPIAWMHARRGSPRSIRRRLQTIATPTAPIPPARSGHGSASRRRSIVAWSGDATTPTRRQSHRHTYRMALACSMILILSMPLWLSHAAPWLSPVPAHRHAPAHTHVHAPRRGEYLFGVCVFYCSGLQDR